MSKVNIQATKNYSLFTRSADNRPTDLKKHKKLMESMRKYGFLRSFPIVCVRDAKGRLVVKDGQHRLMIAESLGLTVYWVEEAVDFDIATINGTAKVWQLKDYAQTFAAKGCEAYRQGLEFAKEHGIPLGKAFALLAGTTTFCNCESAFMDGTFKIKDRTWADTVAGVYGPLSKLSPLVANDRFLSACMAVCRVKDFDPVRLLRTAERCRERLVSFSTKEAYLEMIESIYNYQQKRIVPLKVAAIQVMRDRNAVKGKREGEAA